METKEEKEFKLKQNESDKIKFRQQNRKNKQEYYEQKTQYVQELHKHVQNEK